MSRTTVTLLKEKKKEIDISIVKNIDKHMLLISIHLDKHSLGYRCWYNAGADTEFWKGGGGLGTVNVEIFAQYIFSRISPWSHMRENMM